MRRFWFLLAAAIALDASTAHAKTLGTVVCDGGRPHKIHMGSRIGKPEARDANGVCPQHLCVLTPSEAAEDPATGVTDISLQQQPNCQMKVVPSSAFPADTTYHDPSGLLDNTMPGFSPNGAFPNPTPTPGTLGRALDWIEPANAEADPGWRWFLRELTVIGTDILGTTVTETGIVSWGLWSDTNVWTDWAYTYMYAWANPAPFLLSQYFPPWHTNWASWTLADNGSSTQIYEGFYGDFGSCWTPYGPINSQDGCYFHHHAYNTWFYVYPGITGLPYGQCQWSGEYPWVRCVGARYHF